MHRIKAFLASASPYSIQGQQLMNLLILLFVGKLFLDVHISWSMVGMVVVAAIVIEHGLLYLRDDALRFFSFSAILTALGVAFMVHADYFVIYVVILALALLQKYVVRIKGFHIFNPSNLAVTLAVLLFPQHTYIEMWQWGHHMWLGGMLFLLGFFMLWRVHRVWIPLVFLMLYISLQFYFLTRHGIYPIDFLWTRVFSGGFLIYSIFMLTDPRTTPERLRWQVFFVIMVAVVATALDMVFDVEAVHLFWALTLTSAWVPVMRCREDARQHHASQNDLTRTIMLAASLSGFLLLAMVFYSL